MALTPRLLDELRKMVRVTRPQTGDHRENMSSGKMNEELGQRESKVWR